MSLIFSFKNEGIMDQVFLVNYILKNLPLHDVQGKHVVNDHVYDKYCLIANP